MIHSNKMIYQPPKYHHSNSFTHFLQLHSSISGSNNNSIAHSNRMIGDDSISNERTKLEIHDQNSNTSTATTEIDVANESVGKSFTIAAILGLKKNSMGLQTRHNCEDFDNENGPSAASVNEYNTEFPSIINLTTHSKIFQKFDNDNRHNNYMLSQQSAEHSSQMPMPIEQCMYDNSTTSNSSYQEHLHKQHINSEFNVNYNRNVDELSLNPQTNPAAVLRNHIHPSLNKAFNNRDRSRVDHFNSNKNKSTSISLKNKRVRTIFTPEQLERLEAEFERQQYMVGPERLYLAHTLQLTEAQVKVWFQNRRIKSRKQHFEMTQHHLAIARQRQQQQTTSMVVPNKEEESVNSDEQIVSDDADD